MSNFSLLLQYLKENSYPLTRFFFYDQEQMTSVTFASQTLFQKNCLPYEKELIFDLNTGFSHPTSLQPTYCLLASITGDARDSLSQEQNSFLATIFFSLDETSSWQDFRSELLLEGQKSGLELLFHTAFDSELMVELFASNLLNLADSLEKFKIITETLAQSYAREVNWNPRTINLVIKKEKKCSSNQFQLLYNNHNYDIFYLKSINDNCYQIVKNLCGHHSF